MYIFSFDVQIVHVNIILCIARSAFWSERFLCYVYRPASISVDVATYYCIIIYHKQLLVCILSKKKQQKSLVLTFCVCIFCHVYDLSPRINFKMLNHIRLVIINLGLIIFIIIHFFFLFIAMCCVPAIVGYYCFIVL